MIYSFPNTNFNLYQIANSGQCFRWYQQPIDTYLGRWQFFIDDDHAIAWNDSDRIVVDTEAPESFVRHYFDIDTDYDEIIRTIPEIDTYLYQAASMFKGIRILRQSPWEVFISFILSQNNSIPRIKKSIKCLCDQNSGLFPLADDLMHIDLSQCGLGYRQKYIESYLRHNKFYIPPAGSDYRDAFAYYQTFQGIGPKVANCICLYGLHYLEACPIDRWMKRITDNRYGGTNPEWMSSKYAGVYQQYCFCYEHYLDGRDK